MRVLAEADGDALRLVRVNGAASEWIAADVAAVESIGLDGIVLPKATAAAVGAVRGLGVPVVAIVETPAGLRGAFELATTAAVEALVLGAVDLGLTLGLEPRDDGLELLFARSSIVVDSAAAGLRGPIDQVWTTLSDDAGLQRDCELARSRSDSVARRASTRNRCLSSTTRSRRRKRSSPAHAMSSARSRTLQRTGAAP